MKPCKYFCIRLSSRRSNWRASLKERPRWRHDTVTTVTLTRWFQMFPVFCRVRDGQRGKLVQPSAFTQVLYWTIQLFPCFAVVFFYSTSCIREKNVHFHNSFDFICNKSKITTFQIISKMPDVISDNGPTHSIISSIYCTCKHIVFKMYFYFFLCYYFSIKLLFTQVLFTCVTSTSPKLYFNIITLHLLKYTMFTMLTFIKSNYSSSSTAANIWIWRSCR